MWETDPTNFAAHHQLPAGAVRFFRCTAEHLKARCDGGQDSEENVVAACYFCNSSRHKSKRPKDAVSYAQYVQSRMDRSRWYPVLLRTRNPDYVRDESGEYNLSYAKQPTLEPLEAYMGTTEYLNKPFSDFVEGQEKTVPISLGTTNYGGEGPQMYINFGDQSLLLSHADAKELSDAIGAVASYLGYDR